MVIYHGITTYHILELWLHKLIYHKNDEAIIILPEFIKDKFSDIEDELPKSVFEKIIIFPYLKLNFSIREKMETQLNEVMSKIDIIDDIKNADEIYVAGAQYYFSHWLINNSISFNFFEEAAGRLSKPEVVMQNVESMNKLQYEIALEDGMFIGNNKLVKKKYYNKCAQLKGFIDDLAEDFNIVSELKNISETNRKEILNFFGSPKNISFSSNSAIILSQHFANLNMMSFEEQALLYQMSVDYYLENYKIYVKTHPDDLMFYENLIEDCSVIREKFPSELLPFISDTKADLLMTISSTGINNIRNGYEKIIEFNPEYEKSFLDNNKYYLAAKLITKYADREVFAVNLNEIQLYNMLHFSDCNGNSNFEYYSSLSEIGVVNEACFYIIGKLNADETQRLLENINDNDIICFLNLDLSFSFYKMFDKHVFDYIVPKTIKIEAINKEECQDVGYEYVYIYCKNSEIRSDIMTMHYVKRLINTGIETKIPEMSDEDVKIAALKGMLEATEKRLLYYIQKDTDKK